MFSNLIDVYRAIADDLPAVLVPATAAAGIESILAAVPSHGETFGFELRLTGADQRVDLGIALSLGCGSDVYLANPSADALLARAIILDERWRRLQRFSRRWAVDSSWRVRAPFLFLEFDGDVACSPVPVPSVFIGLDWPIEDMSDEA